MSDNNNLPFFEQLKRGVIHIETEVKQLKQKIENGFQNNDFTQHLLKAKEFDRKIRETYVSVLMVYNDIKDSPISLDSVENEIQEMKNSLKQLENNSCLKNYGYKQWINEESKSSDNELNKDLEMFSINETVVHKLTPEMNFNTNQSSIQMTNNSNESDEKTMKTVIDVSELNQRDEELTQINSKVNNISDNYFGRTPKPYDFGITRNHSIVPQLFLNNNNNNNNKRNKTINKTPEAPTFDSSNTCRFNYMTNCFNLNCGQNRTISTTPPNTSHVSLNGTDSFVTVEFTPGLTTKRPKGISRIKDNHKEEKVVQHIKQLPQSVENEKITPEQPIPSLNGNKSVKLLNTIKGKNSSTPPLPQTRVNANLHNKLLMKK